jgi:prevent-host-death family protein
MTIASIADVKARLSAYLKASSKKPVVITKNGKPVGVLLAVADDDELERLTMAYSPRLRSILDAARQRVQQGQGIAHEDFWAVAQGKRSPKSRTRLKGRPSTKKTRPQ